MSTNLLNRAIAFYPFRVSDGLTSGDDMGGIAITTVRLVTSQELESEFKQLGVQIQSKPEPVSEILRRGETHYTIPNRFTNEVLTVFLQQLIHEHKDQDLEALFILTQNRFQPDPDEAPLYPSDMVDQYRQMGVPEAQIQGLLLREKQLRTSDSKKDIE
jgi:hypothetical protein